MQKVRERVDLVHRLTVTSESSSAVRPVRAGAAGGARPGSMPAPWPGGSWAPRCSPELPDPPTTRTGAAGGASASPSSELGF